MCKTIFGAGISMFTIIITVNCNVDCLNYTVLLHLLQIYKGVGLTSTIDPVPPRLPPLFGCV
jgi:hypothetical protein